MPGHYSPCIGMYSSLHISNHHPFQLYDFVQAHYCFAKDHVPVCSSCCLATSHCFYGEVASTKSLSALSSSISSWQVCRQLYGSQSGFEIEQHYALPCGQLLAQLPAAAAAAVQGLCRSDRGTSTATAARQHAAVEDWAACFDLS